MQKLLITVAATAAIGFTSLAEARTSNTAEYRGYQACLASAESASEGLVAKRAYLMNREGSKAEYFINATRWEEGSRAPVRVECETEANGRQLVSSSVEPGYFTNQSTRVRVELAGN